MYILLLFFWIILNGKFTWEIFGIGALICLALYVFLCRFMGYSPKKELEMIKKLPRALLYVAILLKEILKANWQVIWLIYNAKLEVEPQVVKFRKKYKDNAHNVVLANSITLTPGTITAELSDGEYIVHCLDKTMADGINDSVFTKQLDAMERSK